MDPVDGSFISRPTFSGLSTGIDTAALLRGLLAIETRGEEAENELKTEALLEDLNEVAQHCSLRAEMAEMTGTWTRNGWRNREGLQMPVYEDAAKLARVT